MRDVFVWVPMSDGMAASGTMRLTPSHSFVFEGLPELEMPAIDFSDRGGEGWQELEWRLCDDKARRQFSDQLAQFLGDKQAETRYQSGGYPHLEFLRFLNHHPYADSDRLHIILIPQ